MHRTASNTTVQNAGKRIISQKFKSRAAFMQLQCSSSLFSSIQIFSPQKASWFTERNFTSTIVVQHEVKVSQFQAGDVSESSNGKISIETIPDDNLTGIDTASDTNETEVDVDEDGMEQEEMFVSPHLVLGTDKVEWGGPRRGGRFEEPTRFGDWERKGRCTDF